MIEFLSGESTTAPIDSTPIVKRFLSRSCDDYNKLEIKNGQVRFNKNQAYRDLSRALFENSDPILF